MERDENTQVEIWKERYGRNKETEGKKEKNILIDDDVNVGGGEREPRYGICLTREAKQT